MAVLALAALTFIAFETAQACSMVDNSGDSFRIAYYNSRNVAAALRVSPENLETTISDDGHHCGDNCSDNCPHKCGAGHSCCAGCSSAMVSVISDPFANYRAESCPPAHQSSLLPTKPPAEFRPPRNPA
jgi:hypothetical protein